MASELYNTIDALSKEKGIDPQIVVSAVEDAIVVATRKYYKTQENLRAELDKETGKINAFAVKSIVESPEQVEDPQLQVTVDDARKVDPGAEIGGELKIPKVTEGILGRIAAQLAKQVIFQKVREAERDTVYNEYIGRVGEIVNATVKRIEGPDVILDIGKAEARMPRKEQSRLESFAKGERVQSIIRELRGEKIDIIEYHEDPVTFAEKALQPAKVSRVTVLESAEKHLEVVVDDSQLSLAIGKKGQNVRLAAKLLGWKIDIKSEEEKRQEVEEQMSALVGATATPLENVPGLGEGLVEKLSASGVTTVEALADMTPEQLDAIEGIGPKTVEKISLAVNNYFSSLEGAEETAALPETEMAERTPGGEGVEEAPACGENVEAVPEAVQAEGAVVQDSDEAEQTEAAVGEEIAAQADHSGETLPEDNSGDKVPEEKEKE